MPQIQDDFRSTAEDVAHDATEITRIEEEKAELDPADPRAATLSERAEELADELHRKALVERDLSDVARAAG